MPLAEGERKEPEPALEIQDSQHNVVRTIPIEPMCMSHGWGPFTIAKGKAQRTFVELTTALTTIGSEGHLLISLTNQSGLCRTNSRPWASVPETSKTASETMVTTSNPASAHS